ncbi:related to PFA4 - Palmitoyltransferase [Moesziomyces antarcticus]|uniref:Palmitoyltransferase PFA4 n=1 Tax=Pseudozyma antarctica TaxID=84753 RepID=A0A5C3FIP6_PSEA2|nr:related to PFA4 - Palmitoyltransferase [Moesziomyces antarcticus]
MSATSPKAGLAMAHSDRREDIDDDDYPSSESDAEIDVHAPPAESQRLLAADEDADATQDRASPSIPAQEARAHGRKRQTPLKWTEIIWVTCTLSLIAILGYSSQLCIMLPYYTKTPSFSPQALAAVLVPFNLGLLGIFYNYYLCVTTDPGSVPLGYQPEWSALEPVPTPHHPHAEAGEMEPSLELKQAIYRPRYCKTCSAYKPPRSHHCKTCERCVLRMDHHCPWLANCVGHNNYAHFIRFLFCVDVTCAYHLCMVSARVLDRFNAYTYWREPSTRELVWLVVNYALCLPVLLLVGVFSAYHFYCTAINQTTIESWEKDRTATMIRRGRIRKIKYPYNLGVARNVRGVLGDNVLTWCLPGQTAGGDGLKFPVTPGLDEASQYRWPPKDPAKTIHHTAAHPVVYEQSGWYGEPAAPDLFPPGASSSSPFTYGDGFNPALRPSNRTYPESEVESDVESSVESDADDDHADQLRRRVAVRRGSEGYEVRPVAQWSI